MLTLIGTRTDMPLNQQLDGHDFTLRALRNRFGAKMLKQGSRFASARLADGSFVLLEQRGGDPERRGEGLPFWRVTTV